MDPKDGNLDALINRIKSRDYDCLVLSMGKNTSDDKMDVTGCMVGNSVSLMSLVTSLQETLKKDLTESVLKEALREVMAEGGIDESNLTEAISKNLSKKINNLKFDKGGIEGYR